MKEISTVELETLLNKGKALNIIDVREVEEVAAGMIPTAINIPLGLLEFRMHELDKAKEYMIICHAGGRSAQAVRFLESQGFSVTNVTGGMLAWKGN